MNLICEKIEMLWHPIHHYWIQNVFEWNFFTYIIFLATFNFIFLLLPKMHLKPNLIQGTDCCHLTNNLKFLKICKDATSWILKLSLIQRTNKVDGEFSRVNVLHLEDIEIVESCQIRSVKRTLTWRLWWSSKYG